MTAHSVLCLGSHPTVCREPNRVGARDEVEVAKNLKTSHLAH